jgi:diguanylate cyclase (GGDEF)-like protein
MTTPRKPENETERLEELRSLEIVIGPDERFDRITRLAQRLFGVPMVAITLVEEDQLRHLSRQGVEPGETAREDSFAAHVILEEDLTLVPDATRDARFSDNPIVVADAGVRFFAGATIHGPRGSKLGSLSLFDTRPHDLSTRDAETLRELATMVERELGEVGNEYVDALTGLSNRRAFELSAATLLDVCRRRGIDATLLSFDLDGFEAINETFGTAEGDEALVQFARHLAATFRSSDVIARYGGDEFLALLVDTGDATLALGRLEAILVSRNAHPMNKFPMDVSIGSAIFTRAGTETLESLVASATQSMEAVKRQHQELDRQD